MTHVRYRISANERVHSHLHPKCENTKRDVSKKIHNKVKHSLVAAKHVHHVTSYNFSICCKIPRSFPVPLYTRNCRHAPFYKVVKRMTLYIAIDLMSTRCLGAQRLMGWKQTAQRQCRTNYSLERSNPPMRNIFVAKTAIWRISEVFLCNDWKDFRMRYEDGSPWTFANPHTHALRFLHATLVVHMRLIHGQVSTWTAITPYRSQTPVGWNACVCCQDYHQTRSPLTASMGVSPRRSH